MQIEVEPNLYASLSIIPKIDTNGSKQQSKRHSKQSPTSYISQKWSKRVRNYRKGGKNLKNFEKFL